MIDLTPLAEAVIALLAALITVYVIPWIKSQTTTAQREELNAWVKIAVQAAEQIYTEPGLGATKKQYVLDYLDSKGFALDEDSLDKMIEAAVLEINKGVL